MSRIYVIIRFSVLKGEWIYILSKKLKYYTKEILKYFNIIAIAFGTIVTIILVKYKPIYKISISGEELGYVENKQAFGETIKNSIMQEKEKNIDSVDIKTNPQYEFKLVSKNTRNKWRRDSKNN